MYDMDNIKLAISIIGNACKHNDVPWLLGGSVGLLLQGVPLQAKPRDIDLYTDTPYIEILFNQLSKYAAVPPHYSETGNYSSTLCRLEISTVPVEVVGSLTMKVDDSTYETRIAPLYACKLSSEMDGVALMPLTHELIFNYLRNRPDRYLPIARKMRDHLPNHLNLFHEIVGMNLLQINVKDDLMKLLGIHCCPLEGV
jgi:hypothetical protein